MASREFSRNEILFNALGIAGFALTDLKRQRSYASEFVDGDGRYLYVDDDTKTKIVVNPHSVAVGTDILGLVAYQTQSSAYRRFGPAGKPTKLGVGFDIPASCDLQSFLRELRTFL